MFKGLRPLLLLLLLLLLREASREIPRPGELPSGKFIARIPRSLHARLTARAKQEGVSLNALVSAFLAESLGRKESIKS